VSDNANAVADALSLLGSAYRGDWSNFDGRSLRRQLDELSAALVRERPFSLDRWLFEQSICPHARSWAEHCGSSTAYNSCGHLRAIEAKLWPAGDDE
jgi:hypothetical protein